MATLCHMHGNVPLTTNALHCDIGAIDIDLQRVDLNGPSYCAECTKLIHRDSAPNVEVVGTTSEIMSLNQYFKKFIGRQQNGCSDLSHGPDSTTRPGFFSRMNMHENKTSFPSTQPSLVSLESADTVNFRAIDPAVPMGYGLLNVDASTGPARRPAKTRHLRGRSIDVNVVDCVLSPPAPVISKSPSQSESHAGDTSAADNSNAGGDFVDVVTEGDVERNETGPRPLQRRCHCPPQPEVVEAMLRLDLQSLMALAGRLRAMQEETVADFEECVAEQQDLLYKHVAHVKMLTAMGCMNLPSFSC